MARISNIEIKQEPQHYTLTISKTIDFLKEYSDFAGEALRLTGNYMKKKDIFPISGPIVCFHNMELENLDVEMGWQITCEMENKDNMCCNLVESRKVVSTIDQGPYEAQDPTLMELFEYIKENRQEAQGPIYYCYLNDTDRPPTEYLTQMSIPIK